MLLADEVLVGETSSAVCGSRAATCHNAPDRARSRAAALKAEIKKLVGFHLQQPHENL